MSGTDAIIIKRRRISIEIISCGVEIKSILSPAYAYKRELGIDPKNAESANCFLVNFEIPPKIFKIK